MSLTMCTEMERPVPYSYLSVILYLTVDVSDDVYSDGQTHPLQLTLCYSVLTVNVSDDVYRDGQTCSLQLTLCYSVFDS